AHASGDAHWDYAGAYGPMAWADLKPEFATCGSGKRQSPINIDESQTLRGPAEAIGFDYRPSSGSVVNNGHTIQVDMGGDNGMMVRGSRYQLVQLHFHHPSEERINYRSFAMVVHLVHKDYMGRLAVVAILLEPGPANAVINNFWTYMPLGPGDRVVMPVGSVDLNGLLPKDQRYYQFMGSLTTPPCSEDVLWMVLKQPVTISQEQMRLFVQQYPNNARPVQPTNGRVVRDAQ
ncbi:MAG: carbonic anhydrase family protein, partial [Betaproteobacteria bacterium]